MSKKILKRSMALGALMAFVITGSAMAAENVKNNFPALGTYQGALDMGKLYEAGFDSTITYDNINITSAGTENPGVSMMGENELKANESIVITSHSSGIAAKSNLSVKDNCLTVSAPIISINDITQDKRSGIHLDFEGAKVYVKEFNTFSIDAKGQYCYGIRVHKEGALVDAVGKTGSTIKVDAGSSGLVMTNKGTINLAAGYIYITSTGRGTDQPYKGQAIANTGGGTINVSATDEIVITNTRTDKPVNAVYGYSGTINIGTVNGATKKADVIIKGSVKAENIGKINLNLETAKSSFNGFVNDDNIADEYSGTNLLLSGGAIWNNPENSSVTRLTLKDGVVKQVSEGKSVEVGTLSGKGTFEVLNDAKEQMVVGKKNDGTILTVSTKNQDIEAEDLVDVAVMRGTEKTAADFVEKTGGPIYSLEKYAVKDDGSLIEKAKDVDSANLGVRDMAALSLMSWRAETNDMNKRMGELRNANGEHGVWVRMVGGEDEYKSTEYEYTQYQLGYDEKLSTDPSWTVGVALNYTDGDVKFTNGSGEIENKGVSIYGSKLNEDGSFIDLIAKYSRMENDFKTISGMGEGDYGTNAYSFSAEYGKRFEQGKDLWIEPQVELTYGKVSAVDYVTKEGVAVAQDGMESLVGRIGFSLGKNIKQGNVYARASYLYDFDGKTKAVLDDEAVLKSDLGGGWWEVGVGTNINLSKATYIYADIEKTFGGEVDTNWQWNLGVRYSF